MTKLTGEGSPRRVHVVNPASPGNRGVDLRRVHPDRVGADGEPVLVTTPADPGAGLVARALALGADTIRVHGGDGTLGAVFAGLIAVEAQLRPVVEIVPSGTANLLAREVLRSRESAGDVALRLGRVRLETARGDVVETVLHSVLGIGNDAASLMRVPPVLKRMVGPAAYVLAGLPLLERPGVPLQVRVEGGRDRGTIVWSLLVGNVPVRGVVPGVRVFRRADPNAPGLAVLSVPARAWGRVFGYGSGRDVDLGESTAGRLVVGTEGPVPVQVDGEVYPDVLGVEVTADAAVVRVRLISDRRRRGRRPRRRRRRRV
ncbi:diacylglycerol/lipid kinase family protein [Brevibacterium litoralis]|uniref:diacylglycerol/lipid kinase family protein n=1 Tax=Brevibacterium litoralis TaxID=3138935 RepID=UPI0032ED46AD